MGRKKSPAARTRPEWWTDEMRQGYIAWLTRILDDLGCARRALHGVADPGNSRAIAGELHYRGHQISTVKWLIAVARQSLTSRPADIEDPPSEPS